METQTVWTPRAVAVDLARRHRDEEPLLRGIFFYPASEEVRLLEVVENSPMSDEVHAFRFAPDREYGMEFPVVIIEMSSSDFERLGNRELQLPEEWRQSQAERIA